MPITRYLTATQHVPEQRTSVDPVAALRALISVSDGTNIDLSYNSSTGVITASITGTLARGNLPSEIAYEDEANTFSANQRINGFVGLNVAPATTVGLGIRGTMTGATAQNGLQLLPTFDNGCTAQGTAVQVRAASQAASYTMALASGLHVLNAIVGAGSTITTQVGVDVATLSGAGTNIAIRTGNNRCLLGGEVEIDGDLNHDGSNAGVLGATPVARQTVTGSRGGNAALASLLTAMATFGWITDSTTA